jgi:hypothetical protein
LFQGSGRLDELGSLDPHDVAQHGREGFRSTLQAGENFVGLSNKGKQAYEIALIELGRDTHR